VRALTVLQPWATCIAHHGKDIENRCWVPSPRQLRTGDRFAIHAGARWAPKHAIPFRIGDVAIDAKDVPYGCVVAVATFGGVMGGIESQSPWADGLGSWCWILQRVVALSEPVPCRGAQGLWRLRGRPLEEVLAQLAPAPTG